MIQEKMKPILTREKTPNFLNSEAKLSKNMQFAVIVAVYMKF